MDFKINQAKKNIAIVSANNDNGGAARATRRIAKGLTEISENSNLKFQFICNGNSEIGYSQKSPTYKWYVKFFYNNYQTHYHTDYQVQKVFNGIINKIWKRAQSKNFKDNYPFFRIGNSLNYKKTFKDVDLIHIFWGQTFINPYEIAKLNKPTVITLHDMWFITGGFTYTNNQELDKQKYLNLLGKANFNNQLLMKMKVLKKKNTKIVVTSNWMAEKVKQAGIHEERISKIINHIPNNFSYLNSEKLCRGLLGWDPSCKSKKIIYFSGSIKDKRKGFIYFVESIARLNDEIKSQIAIQILGVENKKIDLLEKMNISYLSLGVFSDELSQVIAYNAADILICPSKVDNTPNVIAEAQMCGLPCIGLKETGSSEMIEDGLSGLIYTKNKPEDLASLISNFVLEKIQFNKTVIASWATNNYGIDNTCKKYLELYASLL